MNKKKRVLLVSEAHYLASGFGTYSKQILRRLHDTGKYEIAEFACYGKASAVQDTDWLFYANMAEEGSSPEEIAAYAEHGVHQFGAWRFDRVCLDFKPDVVLCYRDPWMDMWIKDSPLRPYFHWIWMPTVDSSPQRQEWINGFAECDALFGYSEFGVKVLKEQGKATLNVIGCASPGIDPSIYVPVKDKGEHRKALGIDPDCFIVGTVMRNQRRKLFFELMKAFRLFLDKAPPELSRKSYLYLHTSYPEPSGWDIPDGIMQNGLGGKVLMTYVCKNCKKFSCQQFKDAMTWCPHCQNLSAVCPTVTFGLTIEDLVKVYNLFDLYAQYAICEGFGMPQVEAASCGVPIAATNYSAMEDVVTNTRGYPVPVKKFFRELETNAERAYPDNDAMCDIMLKCAQSPTKDRTRRSMEARSGAVSRYNWDDTAKQWEDYIDSYTPVGKQGNWDTPAVLPSIPESKPDNFSSNNEFVEWLFSEVMKEPERVYKEEGVRLVRDLNLGAQIGIGSLSPLNQDGVFELYKNRALNKIQVEQVRCGALPVATAQYVIEAHNRRRKQDG
jgi:glycosyltransferase involved in cell wall biosynthesis